MTDNNAWELRQEIDRLSKAGDHDQAIALGESALEQHPAFAPLTSSVAWALYRRDLRDLDDQKPLGMRQRAKAALDRIAQLCEAEPYGKFSPWPTAALKMASVMVKRWPHASLDILARLDPKQLGCQKDSDFDPPRARWVMLHTKALELASRWEPLLAACDEALGMAWLSDDDKHWITLRRCEALRHLGRAAEAEPILRAKAEQGREWWLFGRLAEVLASLEREEEAIGIAYRALNSTRVTSFQWGLVSFLASLLAEREPALAATHARLARAFRREQGWPPDKALEALCRRLGLADEDQSSSQALVAELGAVWRQVEDAERATGRVLRHLNEGSGFIQPDEGGEALYFCRPRQSDRPLPAVGARVSYLVQNSFDKKKNRESARAVKWRELGD